MNFDYSEEQLMLIDTARRFVEQELYPFEQEVEQSGDVRPELRQQIIDRSIEAGLYAAAMPEELGGGGLDSLSMCMLDRELGRASYALQYTVGRPSNILQACTGEQREKYLYPCIRGEKTDCLAMTEPGAGSDVRSMSCKAERDGDDFVINGAKHFISHADVSDFVILFAATGADDTPRGPRKRITSFLIDTGAPGYAIRPGYQSVSIVDTIIAFLNLTNAAFRQARYSERWTRGLRSQMTGWAIPDYKWPRSVWGVVIALLNWPANTPPAGLNSTRLSESFRESVSNWQIWP